MRNPSREVVITGVGVCCHMGDDIDGIHSALREGVGTPFQRWEPAVEFGAQCQLIGIFPKALTPADLGVDKAGSRFAGRAALLALHCSKMALAQSQIEPRGLAVVVGSGTGDVDTHRSVQQKLEHTKNAKKISPTIIPRLMASTVSANLAVALGATGPSFSVAAACAGGAYNVLLAAELIEHGHAEAAIAGGVEVADLHFYVGFDSMRAYNSQDNDNPERASRPYAADRAGFVFGEGAAVLVLETREAAVKRGADIFGTLLGYGMSSDGSQDMVNPSPTGAELAMKRALDHAGITPDNVDYINTHGTSTPAGDVSEIRAVRRLFKDRHLPYSSTKGYTGHTISAAGAMEAAFTLAMLRNGWIAPSVHAQPLDPELHDYPPALTPTTAQLGIAVSNSFGFGGTNVSLVLGRP